MNVKLNIYVYFSCCEFCMYLNINVVMIVGNVWEILIVKVGIFKELMNKIS